MKCLILGYLMALISLVTGNDQFGLVLVDQGSLETKTSSGPQIFFMSDVETNPKFRGVRDFMAMKRSRMDLEGMQIIRKHVNSLRFGTSLAIFDSMVALSDLVHDFEYAQYFVELEGHVPLLDMIQRSHSAWEMTNDAETMLKQCFGILGTAAQNNPFVTDILLGSGVLETILPVLETRIRVPPNIRSSAIFSLSCILRTSDDSMNQFIDLQGMTILSNILDETMLQLSALGNFVDNEKRVVHKLISISRDIVELKGPHLLDSKWCYRILRILHEKPYKHTNCIRENIIFILKTLHSECTFLVQQPSHRLFLLRTLMKSKLVRHSSLVHDEHVHLNVLLLQTK